ncbi:MAG: putative 2-aminoethylphosphonate ABC transporter substrate-binding protein [Proteobacteria bacterium]|nr:putative 2-aminoethylphosphonate ABC transporter substrate-binding protein [Pseudomonadota bacterium]
MSPILATFIRLAVVAALALVATSATAQDKTRLVVYSTLVPEFIDDFKKGFEADHPDIEIVWQRDSTGTLTAKLLAEKDNPRGDFIWGLAITSMMLLDKEGMLLPYAPANLAAIKPLFRDAAAPPRWVGMEAWAAAICFNTREAAKLNLPRPQSWHDLLDPAFKGRIIAPHPASSGTGFFHVTAWLQIFGETEGWKFMDRLHDNVALYSHSGSQPCRLAAQGEYPLAIGYDLVGAAQKAAGAPLDVLVMREGGGWEVDAAGIVRGTQHPDAARKLADWAASRKANELYGRYATLVAAIGVTPSMPGYPDGVEESLIKNDFAWAAANRDRILAEWQRRYEAKAAPK